MTTSNTSKEISIIILASIIIGLSISFSQKTTYASLYAVLTILLVILINIFSKKIFAYNLEVGTSTKFWAMKHFGLEKSQKFKSPLYMLWLPIVTSLITLGNLVWIAILEFDVFPLPERISKRHGLYRYTEVTEWHISLIAIAGILANIFFGIIGYLIGFEYFAKWSIIYAFWSMIPISRLDGTKIFFGSRNLWFGLFIILLALLLWGLSIF